MKISIVFYVTLLLLTACGGGGTPTINVEEIVINQNDDNSTIKEDETEPNANQQTSEKPGLESTPPTTVATISGSAVKGVLKYARVAVYGITEEKVESKPLAQSITDEHGSYRIQIENYTGSIIVNVSKSTDHETTMMCDLTEGCGDEINFGDEYPVGEDFSLKAVLAELKDGSDITVNVTAISDLSAALTIDAISEGLGKPVADLIQENNEKIANLFELKGDFLTTPTVDLTAVNDFAAAGLETQKIALLSAALLKQGVQNGLSIERGLDAVKEELIKHDGQFVVEDSAAEDAISLLDRRDEVVETNTETDSPASGELSNTKESAEKATSESTIIEEVDDHKDVEEVPVTCPTCSKNEVTQDSSTNDNTEVSDITPPTETSLSIANGTATNNREITLSLSAVGATDVKISENEDMSDAVIQAYSASASFTLSDGDGVKTVHVTFLDAFNNASPVISDTITLDTTGPKASVLINNGSVSTTVVDVDLTTTATDLTGVAEIYISKDGTFTDGEWATVTASTQFSDTHSIKYADLASQHNATIQVYVKLRDTIGNESEIFTDSISLNRILVSGMLSEDTTWSGTTPFVINGNLTITKSVTLTIDEGVEVQYAGAFTVLVKGALAVNGTESGKVTFTATPDLDDSEAVQLRFRETNLSNSVISHAKFEKATTSLEIEGADCPIRDYPLHNEGTLIIENTTINSPIHLKGIDGCDPSNFGNKVTTDVDKIFVNINDSTLLNTAVVRDDYGSAELWVDSSTLNNVAVTNDDYMSYKGVWIVNSKIVNSTIYARQITLESDTVNASTLTNYSGFLRAYDVQFFNTTIDSNAGYMSIGSSSLTYDAEYSDPQNRHLVMAQGLLINSNINGANGGYGVSIDYTRWTNANLNILEANISGFARGVNISNRYSDDCPNGASSCITITNSNLTDNTINLQITGSRSVKANNNYWGVSEASAIADSIEDGEDDFESGMVDFSDYLAAEVVTEPEGIPTFNPSIINLKVRGSFNHWTSQEYLTTNAYSCSSASCFTQSEGNSNIFTYTTQISAGTHEFLITDADWNIYIIGGAAEAESDSEAMTLGTPLILTNSRNSKNIQLTVPATGNVTFTLDMSDYVNPALTVTQ